MIDLVLSNHITEMQTEIMWEYDLETVNFIDLHRYFLMREGYLKGLQDCLQMLGENRIKSPTGHGHHYMNGMNDQMVKHLTDYMNDKMIQHHHLNEQMEEFEPQ